MNARSQIQYINSFYLIFCSKKYTSLLLNKLDVVYHSALRFITGAAARTHHCTLYETVHLSSLSLRRKIHLLIFIAKAFNG